jgi:hypothetical protein
MSKTIVTRGDFDRPYLCGTPETHSGRLLKNGVQQGRSERRAEGVPLGYVDGLNDAKTKLAAFFSSLR